MEKEKNILEAIDFISDKLLISDDSVYEDIAVVLPQVGEMLEDTLKSLEEIREKGYDITKEDIAFSVDRLTEGVTRKDNMLLIDVLSFEIYGMIEGYMNGR